MLDKIKAFLKSNFQTIIMVVVLAYFGAKEFGYLPGRGSAEIPQPAPVVDIEARRLGAAYRAQLIGAADATLDASTRISAGSTAAYGLKTRTEFASRLATAFAPAAAEIERRVGAPAETDDPAKVSAAQAFIREFRAGFRGDK